MGRVPEPVRCRGLSARDLKAASDPAGANNAVGRSRTQSSDGIIGGAIHSGETQQMPQASRTIAIETAPSEVFAFLANPENDRRWRSGVVEISKIAGDGVGSTYHQVVSGPGGRKINADIEITALEPGRLIAFRTTAGPVRPTGRYELSAEGTGTRLTFSLNADLGGIKKLLMGSMVQKTMNSEVEGVERLKSLLESHP